MADPSIPVTVDPKMTVTTAQQAHDLDKAFDELWGPLSDSPPAKSTEPKAETPTEEPPVKEEEPAEEPKAEPTEPAESKEEKPEPKAEETHPDDESDEELDKYALHPNSTPEVVDQFRAVRGMAKKYKKTLAEIQAKQAEAEKELTGLRTTQRPVSDPSVQHELEELRTFRQRHQIYDDSTFRVQYEQPMRAQFDAIINEVKALSPDPNAAAAWEAEMRKLGPDRIDKAYWNEGVIGQVADPLDRDRMIRKVSTLIELQARRNQFAAELAAQPDRYEQYQHEQAADYWKKFGEEAEDETRKILPNLGDWALQKDPAQAKSQAEKEAIQAHNVAYQKYEDTFKQLLTDSATQGPRGMARTAIEAVKGIKYKLDLDNTLAENKKLKAELQKAKEELNKIAGVRSRVAQSTGAAPNGSKPPSGPTKVGKTLDSAFKDFFGS